MTKRTLTPEEMAAKELKMAQARKKATSKSNRKSVRELAIAAANRVVSHKDLKDLEEEINSKAERLADKIVQQRMSDLSYMLKQNEEELRLRPDRRVYKKFSCKELLMIFGGWFTLSYLFSIKNDIVGKDGIEGETDFYICSQDCSGVDINNRPALNTVIKREFNKDVYGFAIIAPASAFGDERIAL